MRALPLLAVLSALAGQAKAQDGADLFDACTACHSVIAPNGAVIVPGGRAGPNLYGVAGGLAGQTNGFNYSDSMIAARARGLRWTPENFAAYLENPTDFLKAYLDDPTARARMAFRLSDGAPSVYAYLQSLGK